MKNLTSLTIRQAHEGLKKRTFSSVDLTQAFLERIKKITPQLNDYVYVATETALKEAKEADEYIRNNTNFNPLTGVPVAIKDIFCTADLPSTAGSKILKDFIPPYDATAVKKLKAQHCVILGKTNTDEFAMGASTETSCYGPTKNPWDASRVAGGSSGGSAAAIASDNTIYALGTDTGGSIRQPASFCGCSGLKVTYGRTSRYGVMAMASSFDTIGPLAKTVEDLALILNIIAGLDPLDSTTPPQTVPDYTANLNQGIKGLKIGVPREYFSEGVEEETRNKVRDSIKILKKLGAITVEVSLPLTRYGVALYYILVPAEVSANLARYDGLRFGPTVKNPDNLLDLYLKNRGVGFGQEAKRRIMLGTYCLSAGYYEAYYQKAQKVRALVIQDFNSVFEEVDLIITPVTPTPAFKISEKTDPLQLYLCDALTIPASAAGLPALALPCGLSSENLPIGLQLIAPQFQEDLLLKVGYTFQKNTDFHLRKPAL
ncbi:Asp-tRNA(Asn)/Glu-tRNA(Gln) amidotransferase GatCAB subunit A [Candidatus Pacearchaeota archaeon CG_4_10_14_0_2_um_filter_30_11]|nr:MAG: Asp-tRNA(Asn)/Glu-tRNA(Gln) amidotransferase GatCAB subunit A [Candidatus Pacearchaeota archaeon CG_4_10_14_0_2_um_filter_30_11]